MEGNMTVGTVGFVEIKKAQKKSSDERDILKRFDG